MLDLCRVVDAVFHLLHTGCQWRASPHEFPSWCSVVQHYAKWRHRGTWEQINTTLRERYRVASGRKAQRTAAIIDSQSARTTEAGGPRGHDGAKKVSRRKRHRLMDTEGTLLKARIHPADSHCLPAGLTRGTEHAREDQRRVLLGRVRIGPGAKRDATRNVPSGRPPTFLEGVVNDHHRLALIQLQYVADLPSGMSLTARAAPACCLTVAAKSAR